MINEIRNILVDSGRFYRVQYKGKDTLHVEMNPYDDIEVKVTEYTGLGALFG